MDGSMPASSSVEVVDKSSTGPKKMSFANVAAMPQMLQSKNGLLSVHKHPVTGVDKGSESGSAEQSLTSSLANLNIQGLESANPEILQFVSKLDDEGTHVSTSSIQAPPSIASGLAFALDEKESIRPDDSASLQAVEDDDSGPGSGAQNSRFGSEAGGRPFQSQLREIHIQRGIPYASKVDDRAIGGLLPSTMNGVHTAQGPLNASQLSYLMPDEKLLEALDSPKDRLFLLQLEQQMIAFVQNPSQEALELPPYNSFLRLLAHRLADYYRLSHFVEGTANALRLYKTPTTQLPTPLSAFRPDVPIEIVPQSAPSLKIMRRLGADGQLRESVTNASSTIPSSKVTSDGSEHEDGLSSPAESSTAKDKATQTREQREAKYKEVRDRIFANWKEEKDGEPSANTSADASRASSVTGKKKKKKPRDDDFEARSAFYHQESFDPSTGQGGYFVPYMVPAGTAIVPPSYGPVYQTQYPMMAQPTMVQTGLISPPNSQIMYQQPMGQQYANFGMPQQLVMGSYYHPMVQPHPQMVQTHPQMPYGQHFIQNPCPSVPAQVSRPGSQMSEQSWNQSVAQNQYHSYPQQAQYTPQTPQPVSPPSSNGPSIPYAYGQLPYQGHSPDNRSAHPLPGSYSRPSYKAQTRVTSATVPQHSSNQPIQYSCSPQAMVPGQYLNATSGSPNSDHTRKQTPYSMHSPPASTISKWGTPSTLPPKPPPPVAPRIHDTSMPTYQNGTYTRPSNPPQDARAV